MKGTRLKELRLERRLSQDRLAKMIGTTKQTIHRYETGEIGNIPHDKIERLAECLGVHPSDIMGWDEISTYNNSPLRVKRLPVLGNIACGKPIYAEAEHENFVVADETIDADFCLRAQGDSMTGARIFDGDIVFIRSQDTVENGEIAVVVIEDEATLKRVYFYPEEGKLILSPENPRYAPLVYLGEELDHIKILGKAVAFQSVVR